MITVKTTDLRGHIAPLYCRLPNPREPQPAFIELNSDGVVRAGHSHLLGGVAPDDVRRGVAIRFAAAPTLRGTVIADILESDAVRSLLEIIHAGHTVTIVNGKKSGKLSQDAIWCWDGVQGLVDELIADLNNHINLGELQHIDAEIIAFNDSQTDSPNR
jgi:hypothetical protein